MKEEEKKELDQLFSFFREIDKEKFIGRQTYLTDAKRKEKRCRACLAYGSYDAFTQ